MIKLQRSFPNHISLDAAFDWEVTLFKHGIVNVWVSFEQGHLYLAVERVKKQEVQTIFLVVLKIISPACSQEQEVRAALNSQMLWKEPYVSKRVKVYKWDEPFVTWEVQNECFLNIWIGYMSKE